jgi:RNA polymerase-binding transcription factor DksA
MPSTSILPPAARRSQPSRHRGFAQLPAAGRVHPGPGGLAQRRAQLEARWRERLERVTELSLAYHEAAQCEPSGLPGGATRASERSRELARQAVAERQALAEIEAALDRIAAGCYGRCEQCGKAIATALLTAAPQARYCAPCNRQSAQRSRSPELAAAR